jgi:hypothetical protein
MPYVICTACALLLLLLLLVLLVLVCGVLSLFLVWCRRGEGLRVAAVHLHTPGEADSLSVSTGNIGQVMTVVVSDSE